MVQVLQGNGRLRVFKPWDADAADHYSSESQILAAENSKKKSVGEMGHYWHAVSSSAGRNRMMKLTKR